VLRHGDGASAGGSVARDLAILPDGTAWVAGGVDVVGGGFGEHDLALWRVGSDGVGLGPATVLPGPGTDRVGRQDAMGLTPDGLGGVFVTGFAGDAVGEAFGLWRFDAAGRLMAGFPVGGVPGGGLAVWVGADHVVRVAGTAIGNLTGYDFALWHMDRLGRGGAGEPLVTEATEEMDLGRALTTDSLGNTWVTGQKGTGDGSRMAVWKFDAGGALAAGFPRTFRLGFDTGMGHSIVADDIGQVWVAGNIGDPPRATVLRLGPGEADEGAATLPTAEGAQQSEALDIALGGDGRVWVSGTLTGTQGFEHAVLWRL